MLSRRHYYSIFALYFLLALGYSLATPLWEAPDEPSHYRYAEYISFRYALPPPTEPYWISGPTSLYEWYQMPLYYAFVAPSIAFANALTNQKSDLVFPPFNSMVTPHKPNLFSADKSKTLTSFFIPFTPRFARLTSIGFGLAILITLYRFVRTISPYDDLLALTAVSFVALMPQFTFITGYITNDNLTMLMGALCQLKIAQLISAEKPINTQQIILFGIYVTLAIFTKLNLAFMVFCGIAAIGLRDHSTSSRIEIFKRIVCFSSLALLPHLCLWVLFPSIRMQWAESTKSLTINPNHLSINFILELWPMTLHSFWGIFGWMNVPTPAWTITIMNSLALVGLGATLWTCLRPQDNPPRLRWHILFCCLSLLFILISFVRFNLAIRQPQGRLLYPALPAIAFLVCFGLLRLFGQYRRIACFALILWMFTFNLYALLGTLIPAYSNTTP